MLCVWRCAIEDPDRQRAETKLAITASEARNLRL